MSSTALRSSAALAFAAFALFSPAPLVAEVIIPEGIAGTALRVSDDMQPAGRIEGLGNVHGMDVALSRGYLVSASLDEQPRNEIMKPATVAQDEHAAHHSKDTKADPAVADVSVISLVDIATGQITRKIEVPGMVHHVAVGANDRFALVTHPSLDSISLIDLDKGEVTATIATGPNPNYAVYDPKTAAFYVSNAGNATISQVDPEKGYLVRNLRTMGGAEHMAIDVAGRRLFAAEADSGILDVINLDTGAVDATFEIGGELHGVAYDAMRDAVYVNARENGQVAWIDLATGAQALEAVGPEPYHMALDGNRLLVSSAEENVVWVIDTATRQRIQTIATSDVGHQMVVLPGS